MRRSQEFLLTRRSGVRVAGDSLIMHFDADASVEPPRVGITVSRAVGNAVERNVVKRRLREVMREVIRDGMSSGRVVVQARPSATNLGWPELRHEADALMARAIRRHESRHRPRTGGPQ